MDVCYKGRHFLSNSAPVLDFNRPSRNGIYSYLIMARLPVPSIYLFHDNHHIVHCQIQYIFLWIYSFIFHHNLHSLLLHKTHRMEYHHYILQEHLDLFSVFRLCRMFPTSTNLLCIHFHISEVCSIICHPHLSTLLIPYRVLACLCICSHVSIP